MEHGSDNHLEVGIVGLGLIGGSLAKAIKAANRHARVVAHDRDGDSLARAVADRVVDEAAWEPGEAFSRCAIVVLCTPVRVMPEIIRALMPHLREDCVLMDAGSTKRDVMDMAAQLGLTGRFVGGHPMAGSEKTGYGASRANLFENAWFVLTPFAQTPPALLETATRLVSLVGAMPLRMEADAHDRTTAFISHLPHVVATVLVNTVAEAEDPSGNLQRLAAGGFKDLTRIASASPALWTGISLSNREMLLEALRAVSAGLSGFRDALETGDDTRVQAVFAQGRDWRDSLSDTKGSRVPGYAEITVDVEDKPGIIARIAVMLARAEINIKNIGINNVREEDEGALLIRFETAAEGAQAASLLRREGYGVRLRGG
jgi:prephenate dehydrogenase